MRPPQTVFGAFAGAVTTLVAIAIYWTMQGAHPWVEQTPTWPTVYGVFPTIGDGSNARGGIPPVVSEGREPAVIPSNYPLAPPFFDVATSSPAVGTEPKFRTQCDFAFNGQFDPILYPNRPDLGHMHTFFGNKAVTPASNYASLRLTGDSTCAGGPVNRSAYWYPSVLKDDATGDGRTKIKMPNYTTVYYVVPSVATVSRMQRIPRGMGYVFGFNPADPNNDYVQDTFTGTFYEAATGINGTGFMGWKCESTDGSIGANANPVSGYTNLQPYLRNADGTATLDCPTNEHLIASLKGPGCWDGVNLMSPNGRKHVFPSGSNIHNLGTGPYCPEGWYHIAYFELIILFTHEGYTDYKEWYLSSDRMTDAAFIHSDQECHDENIINGVDGSFCNGQTMHSDWFGAWDYSVMEAWMKLCNGTSDESWTGESRHECNGSEIGDGRILNDGSPFVDTGRLSAANSWIDLPQQP